MTKPENIPALLATLRTRAHTEAILRDGDPYYDLDKGEASAWDKTVTPDTVLTLVHELERLQPAPGSHEFTGTVKRADGVTVTVTLAVPEGHGAVKPEPTRPWHGPDRTNQNFLELGEIVMMMAQRSYSTFEGNERSRQHWAQREYWADITTQDWPNIPTQAIEAPKP